MAAAVAVPTRVAAVRATEATPAGAAVPMMAMPVTTPGAPVAARVKILVRAG
jgi:hypothetical protein